MHLRRQTDQPRILITNGILHNFFMNILKGTVSELASERGLPYGLVYNLAHGRIKSVSAEVYERIFGEETPYQESGRVDGEYFREMVRLWLFLNGDATKKDLYGELYPGKKFNKVDYRIFTGEIKTVDVSLEKVMEKTFFYQGFERPEIQKWVEELCHTDNEQRVPYEEAKPVLEYLQEVLKINPTRILNQCITRYESGELKTISMKIHRYILDLKKRADNALRSASRFEIENLWEEICGKREGFTLFSEIEDELDFLRNYGGKSPRKYLGRSISNYKKSKLVRIASWRAQKIRKDCNELIRKKPETQLVSLPKFHLKLKMSELLFLLKSLLIKRMIEDESGTYERLVLTPSSHGMEEYRRQEYGLTSMDNAGSALGMHKKAFDLMVATHSDIFRRIARYDGEWYLPNLYIKELKEKEGFSIVKEKYELLAKGDM